jgi:hypothetical protein
MSTAIRSSLTDHSTLDGTGDEINGSEVDENGFTVADILDGTTSTDLAGAGVVDFVFTTSRSGLRLIDLDNAASAVHTALTVEWDPGDGGNLTDNGSGIGIDFIMPDDADNQDTYASINTMVVSDATTAEEGELSFKVVKAGTNTEVLTIGSGVSTFSQKITVGVDDAGHDVKFFGASAGAYMEWDESADQLRIMGAEADATTSTGKLLLATSLTDINANDVLGKIDFQAPHEAGETDAIAVAASIEAIAQATFSASVNATDLIFSTGSSGAASEKFRITSDGELGVGGANYGTDGQVLTSTGAGTAPAWEDSGATAADDIGTGDAAVSIATTSGNITIDAQANDADVIIKVDDGGSAVTALTLDGSDEGNAIFVNDVQLKSDSALLEFGADLDTSLTHTDGTGLTLNSTNKLTFGDAASFVQQSADGTLRIDGEAIIDLNASTRVDVSGDLKVGGEVQTASIGYTDGDNAITIADGGGVTFAQAVSVGSNALTTTGVITGGTVEATTDTAAGNNAAMGYDSADGLVLTGQGSTNDVTIRNDADGAVLEIATGTTNVEVTSGNLIIGTSGKGIDFSATADAGGMTSELLDDYEEGTWTPTILFGGNSVGAGYSAQTAFYTKIGNVVTISGLLTLSSKGSSTGSAAVGSLPFTVAATGAGYAASAGYINRVTFADVPLQITLVNTSTIGLQEVTNAGERSDLTDGNFADNAEVFFNLTYRVA